MLADLYSTVAQTSFTLLGKWWVVLQRWPPGRTRDPARRRTGCHVSLYFLLPGTMSAPSLPSDGSSFTWRDGFGLARAVGSLEALTFVPRTSTFRAFLHLSAVLYVAGAVVAAAPALADVGAEGVTALHIEGALLVTILFLGLNLAWAHLVRGDYRPER